MTFHAHIITNFPQAFPSYLDCSILRIAQEKKAFAYHTYNLSDFSDRPQRRIDDKPFGGGAGTVIEITPMVRAIRSIEASVSASESSTPLRKIYLGPSRKLLTQARLERLAGQVGAEHVIFLCGHYEGVDARVFDIFDFEIYSLGRYVVSSGEIATLVCLDGIVRLLPGVVGNPASIEHESYGRSLAHKIEYPQYTRPADFEGHTVPSVLLSGDHSRIAAWRKTQLK